MKTKRYCHSSQWILDLNPFPTGYKALLSLVNTIEVLVASDNQQPFWKLTVTSIVTRENKKNL